ncbi:MAG: hypothetical protein JNK16_15435 [Phycisphaerales bacterium]|nr:hypothetical protein [Phycisphaerales bacterium]
MTPAAHDVDAPRFSAAAPLHPNHLEPIIMHSDRPQAGISSRDVLSPKG